MEDNDVKEQQQLAIQFQMFEQQMQNIQQQLQAVEQAIVDMGRLNLVLDELKGGVGKEIVAPIGKGIFAKANLSSEELLVDIGEGNIIQKTIPQTKELIQEQIKKLEHAREELNKAMEEINGELEKIFLEAQKDNN